MKWIKLSDKKPSKDNAHHEFIHCTDGTKEWLCEWRNLSEDTIYWLDFEIPPFPKPVDPDFKDLLRNENEWVRGKISDYAIINKILNFLNSKYGEKNG